MHTSRIVLKAKSGAPLAFPPAETIVVTKNMSQASGVSMSTVESTSSGPSTSAKRNNGKVCRQSRSPEADGRLPTSNF